MREVGRGQTMSSGSAGSDSSTTSVSLGTTAAPDDLDGIPVEDVEEPQETAPKRLDFLSWVTGSPTVVLRIIGPDHETIRHAVDVVINDAVDPFIEIVVLVFVWYLLSFVYHLSTYGTYDLCGVYCHANVSTLLETLLDSCV